MRSYFQDEIARAIQELGDSIIATHTITDEELTEAMRRIARNHFSPEPVPAVAVDDDKLLVPIYVQNEATIARARYVLTSMNECVHAGMIGPTANATNDPAYVEAYKHVLVQDIKTIMEAVNLADELLRRSGDLDSHKKDGKPCASTLNTPDA